MSLPYDGGRKPFLFDPLQKLKDALVRVAALEKFAPSEAEIDFGAGLYQTDKVFNISDGRINANSKITVTKSLKSTSRHSDEVFAESLELSVKAVAGAFDLYVKSLCGSISGTFTISYSIQ